MPEPEGPLCPGVVVSKPGLSSSDLDTGECRRAVSNLPGAVTFSCAKRAKLFLTAPPIFRIFFEKMMSRIKKKHLST